MTGARVALVFLAAALSACGGAVQRPPAATQQATSDADIVSATVRVGDRLLDSGDPARAFTMYEKALEEDPNHIGVLMRLGDLAWRAGAWAQSAGYYDRVLTIEPTHRLAVIGRARTMMVQGEALAALRLLERSQGARPSDDEEHGARALALDLLGRQEDAQVAYAEALDLSPENDGIRSNMALSFAISEDYRTAIELLRQLSEKPASAERARQALAMVYALSGQTDAAIDLSVGRGGEGETEVRAFFERLPGLTRSQKAAAVYFRQLPPAPPKAEAIVPPPPVVDGIGARQAPYLTEGTPQAARDDVVPPEAFTEETPAEATDSVETVEDDGAVSVPVETNDMATMDQPAAAEAPADGGDGMASEEAATAHAESAASPDATGRYWAQVASFRSVAALELAWADITTRHPDLAKAVAPTVQSVDVGDRGTYRRLMVGRFAKNSDAIARCEMLRAVDVDCVVIVNDIAAIPLAEALGLDKIEP